MAFPTSLYWISVKKGLHVGAGSKMTTKSSSPYCAKVARQAAAPGEPPFLTSTQGDRDREYAHYSRLIQKFCCGAAFTSTRRSYTLSGPDIGAQFTKVRPARHSPEPRSHVTKAIDFQIDWKFFLIGNSSWRIRSTHLQKSCDARQPPMKLSGSPKSVTTRPSARLSLSSR